MTLVMCSSVLLLIKVMYQDMITIQLKKMSIQQTYSVWLKIENWTTFISQKSHSPSSIYYVYCINPNVQSVILFKNVQKSSMFS